LFAFARSFFISVGGPQAQEEPKFPEAAANHLSAGQSSAERFEAEAMPHLPNIFRAALRMVGNSVRAEDVTQEVFLQAWRSFHRFEPGTNCHAWLFKILFHCVSQERRKWLRFPSRHEYEAATEANLPYIEPIPERLTDDDILAAIDRLPTRFRAIVLIVDVEEFSYKEASQILSIPLGTVMSRLSRGRRLLREQLEDVARRYGIKGSGEEA
jgi:RNA polymerase sigma-70 factor (ECF subfamily)